MVTIIKKGIPVKEQIKILDAVISRRKEGFQLGKYSGLLGNKIDPLNYQKKMRDRLPSSYEEINDSNCPTQS